MLSGIKIPCFQKSRLSTRPGANLADRKAQVAISVRVAASIDKKNIVREYTHDFLKSRRLDN